jgi:hypothetical protein
MTKIALETVAAPKTTKYRVRPYFATEIADKEGYKKSTPQCRAIIDFMIETKMVGTGAEIVAAAIAAGKIVSRQKPAVLYAFYARPLEKLGVRLMTTA